MASWVWVRPGIGTISYSTAFDRRRSANESASWTILRSASLMYILSAVWTWSLRLRPVWIFLPTGPHCAVRNPSMAVWQSSSSSRMTNVPSMLAAATEHRPFSRVSSSCDERIPMRSSPLAWATDPSTSAMTRSRSRT